MSEADGAPAPAPGSRLAPSLTALALYLYALSVAVPQVRAGSATAALSLLATLLFLALAVGLIVQLARLSLNTRGEVVAALVAVVVWPVLESLARQGGLWRLYCFPLVNLAFIFLCAMAGRLLSRILREPNILLPVALVTILADIFTVYLGPTGRALEVAPSLVHKFSVGLPEAGSAAGAQGAEGLAMAAFMGVGDFVFLTVFMAAAARFGFPLARGRRIIITLLCLGVATYLTLPVVGVELPAIPLLPLIAGGFLVAYWREFRLTSAERQGLIWGGLFLAALLAGGAWAMRSAAPPPAAGTGPAAVTGQAGADKP